MADFLPPTGPPPPQVPEGWTARWNDQYKQWFYVNLHTKVSQWEKPTEPAYPPGEAPPAGPPPGYAPGANPTPPIDSKSPHPSNPFSPQNTGAGNGSTSRTVQEESDAELARRLQAEEDARHRGPSPAAGSGGAAASFYGSQGNPNYGGATHPPPAPGGYSGYDQNPYGQQQQQYGVEGDTKDRGKSGLFNKLLGKAKQVAEKQSGGGSHGGGYPGQYGGHGGSGGMPFMGGSHGGHGGGGGLPFMGGGHGGHGGHGGGMGGFMGGSHGYGGHGGGGHGMPYGGGAHGAPKKSSGMGAGAGAALGLGAGLVGGALIADAVMDGQEDAYEAGFDDGAGDFGGDF